jgi:hypothetical protein
MRKIARLTKELEDYNQKPVMNQLEQDSVTSAVELTQPVIACSSSTSSSMSSSSSSSSYSSSSPSANVDELRTFNFTLLTMREPTEIEREKQTKRKEMENCFDRETWKSNRQIIQDPFTSAMELAERVAVNKKYWEKWKRKRHRRQDPANSAMVLACSSST